MPESWGVGANRRRAAATTEGLLVFLRRSAELRRRREAPGTPGLLRFFERAAVLLRTPHHTNPTEPVRPPLDVARFQGVLSVLGDSIRRAPPSIAPMNVWFIAGLRRNELRNAAVLAWFLDPRGSHGFGAAALRAFLVEVTKRTPGWPNLGCDLSRVTVVTEEWPLGSETDRVDIAINGPDFALFVEVKIDAFEGPDQLRRYADLIERKALAFDRKHGRLIYLSPRIPQNPPPGLGSITWRGVAEALSTLPRKGMSGALAAQFAHHVRAFF
jgi:hypothetical protein